MESWCWFPPTEWKHKSMQTTANQLNQIVFNEFLLSVKAFCAINGTFSVLQLFVMQFLTKHSTQMQKRSKMYFYDDYSLNIHVNCELCFSVTTQYYISFQITWRQYLLAIFKRVAFMSHWGCQYIQSIFMKSLLLNEFQISIDRFQNGPIKMSQCDFIDTDDDHALYQNQILIYQ